MRPLYKYSTLLQITYHFNVCLSVANSCTKRSKYGTLYANILCSLEVAIMSAEKNPDIRVVRCFIEREDGHVLVIKRSPANQNNSGKWEVPGGKVDEGENLAQAQMREIMEETGLSVQLIRLFAFSDRFVINAGRYEGLLYVVSFSVARLVQENQPVVLSTEHSDYAWVSYKEMLARDLTNETRKAVMVLKAYLF